MEFKDRVSNKPNRVKLTYDEGGASTYATVELADEPIEEGTPLNALNMNKLLNKEDNDYIVEQDTIGIWTYRKWASGIAECWGRKASTEKSIDDDSYCVINEALPPNLFITDPIPSCSGFQLATLSSYITLVTSNTKICSAYMKCINPINDDYFCWFYFDIKGRWK
jgi:hypothetical protein